MKKYRVYIKGKVQGVGFRYSVMRYAMEIEDLTGFVQNQDDGSVLLEVVGSQEKINHLLKKIKESKDSFARVDTMTIEEDNTIKVLNKFSIK